MRFGIDVAQQRMSWDELVSRAQFADSAGGAVQFEGLWGFDHFQPMYGDGPGECFEGMTTLAALASTTSRIRLALLVTGVTYRHPSLFTTQAITIDHASHGRLDLAMGAAWFEEEHRALGFDFPSTGARFDLLEETLEGMIRLMTGDRVSYEGKFVHLQNAQVRPVPVQTPHPPIWIGGTGRKRTLPITARYADAWHAFGGPSQMRELSEYLDGLARDAGRDPKSIMRSASLSLSPDFDTVRKHISKMRDVGIEYLICGWPDQGRDLVGEFIETVAPEFA